jgi:hypothetical protein
MKMATPEGQNQMDRLDLENALTQYFEPKLIRGKYRCNGIRSMRFMYNHFSGNHISEDDFKEHMEALGHYPSKNERYKFSLKKVNYNLYHGIR